MREQAQRTARRIGAALLLWTLLAGLAQAESQRGASEITRPDTRTLSIAAPKAGRKRALVAIVADNAGTETTDLVVPYSILKQSGVADVVIVSPRAGEVELMPTLQLRNDTTLDDFDAAQPAGADVVVVPALHHADSPAVLAWLRKQAASGASMVAICDGAQVLANTGLLAHHSATSHWYSRNSLRRRFPDTVWVENRRYVEDGNVMTTSGVSASVPASLALVSALAGPAAASETARRIGVDRWSAAYDASRFKLSWHAAATAFRNRLMFWRHETLDLPLTDGFDELRGALTADAWGRTWRTDVIATGSAPEVASRSGLRFVTRPARGHDRIRIPDGLGAEAALSAALDEIARRYDDATSEWVALQLEYPGVSAAE